MTSERRDPRPSDPSAVPGDRSAHAAPASPRHRGRPAWSRPTLEALAPLTDLTLQTGDAIGGGGDSGGGGSTVF
ncbi:MAG: hypothetical protein ACODAE_05740 [Gemmatimonadota bacterium]